MRNTGSIAQILDGYRFIFRQQIKNRKPTGVKIDACVLIGLIDLRQKCLAQAPHPAAQNQVSQLLIKIHDASYISAYIIANFWGMIFLAWPGGGRLTS